MAIIAVLILGTTNVVAFSFTTLVFIYGLLIFIFYHKYIFKSIVIFINCPRFKV
jgi:hypothetical protein